MSADCGGACRSRRQWPQGRPGISRTISVDPSTAVQAAAAARRPDVGGMSHEDDSLMMCLIAEFGESSRLVADVFNSLRRLDGTHLSYRHVANRVRPVRPAAGTTRLRYERVTGTSDWYLSE